VEELGSGRQLLPELLEELTTLRELLHDLPDELPEHGQRLPAVAKLLGQGREGVRPVG